MLIFIYHDLITCEINLLKKKNEEEDCERGRGSKRGALVFQGVFLSFLDLLWVN